MYLPGIGEKKNIFSKIKGAESQFHTLPGGLCPQRRSFSEIGAVKEALFTVELGLLVKRIRQTVLLHKLPRALPWVAFVHKAQKIYIKVVRLSL